MNLRIPPLVFLWGLAAAMAVTIEQGFSREAQASAVQGPLERMLGSSKEIVGDMMFLKADEYYHGGVLEKFEETAESHEREGIVEEEHEEDDHDHEGHAEAKKEDWIAEVNRRVRSHEHFHLSKDRRKEMLPFFALSAELDPHNIEAILATAYWLDADFNKTDDAMSLLKKGIVENPQDWRLEESLASYYFSRKKDLPQSREHYLRALKKAGGKKLEDHEWVKIYYSLAGSSLRLDQRAEALSFYRKALTHLEGRGLALEPVVRQKIQELS